MVQRHLGRNDVQLLVIIGINLVIGFMPGMNISWQSHVGGLIVGAILMAATLRPLKKGRNASAVRDVLVYLGGLALLVALIVYSYA